MYVKKKEIFRIKQLYNICNMFKFLLPLCYIIYDVVFFYLLMDVQNLSSTIFKQFLADMPCMLYVYDKKCTVHRK